MPAFIRLLSLVLLAYVALASSKVSTSDINDPSFYPDAPYTDVAHIITTLGHVNQKRGSTPDELPNNPVVNTVVTALDGKLSTVAALPAAARSIWSRRGDSFNPGASRRGTGSFWDKRTFGYTQVFDGTGTAPQD